MLLYFLTYFYLSCFVCNLPALLQLSLIYLNFYLTLFLLLFILMLIPKKNSLLSYLLHEFLLICMQQSILLFIPYSLYYFLIDNLFLLFIMILIILKSNLDAFEHGIIPAVVKHIPIDSNVAELYSGKYYVAFIVFNYLHFFITLICIIYLFLFLPSILFSSFFAAYLRTSQSHLLPFYFTSIFILFYFCSLSLSSSFLSIFLYFILSSLLTSILLFSFFPTF